MSTLYTGLADKILSNTRSGNTLASARTLEQIWVGHVLDVVLDDSSPYYNSDLSIGAIRVRLLPDDAQKPENEVITFATPADRTQVNLPLPGEQVLVYPAILGTTMQLVYGLIVQQDFNASYNSQPFIGTSPNNIDKSVLRLLVDVPSLSKRFEQKLQIPLEVYQQAALVLRGLREGDSVYEGRFGSLVHFTSTLEKNNLSTLFKGLTIGGNDVERDYATEDGDPATILAVNRTTPSEPTIVRSNINEDDSSVYLLSTQVLPMEIAASANMHTWSIAATIGTSATTPDATSRLQDFFTETYDPNQVFTINLSVAGLGAGAFPPGGSGQALPLIRETDTDYASIVATVIDKLEGGYYHPEMLKDGRIKDSRYGSSGETMMGIDRKAGGSINDTPAGKQFWGLIDQQNASTTWEWGYRGGALESQLRDLAGQIIYPTYISNTKNYMTDRARAAVAADGRLLFNFTYACWNGGGWFKKWAADLEKVLASGVTDKTQIVTLTVGYRVKEGLKTGSSPNSLIAQGGRKIAQFLDGVTL